MDYRKGLVTYKDFVQRAAQCTVGDNPQGKGYDFYQIIVNITKEDMDQYIIDRDRKKLFTKLGVLKSEDDKLDATITRYFDTFLQAMTWLSNGMYDYMDEPYKEVVERQKRNDAVILEKVKELEVKEKQSGMNFDECIREAANLSFKKNKHLKYLFLAQNFTKNIGISYVVNGDQKQMCWDLGYPCDYIKTLLQNFRFNLYYVSGGFYNFIRNEERKYMFPDPRKKSNNPISKKKKKEPEKIKPRSLIGR